MVVMEWRNWLWLEKFDKIEKTYREGCLVISFNHFFGTFMFHFLCKAVVDVVSRYVEQPNETVALL